MCFTKSKQKGQTSRFDVTLQHANHDCKCSIGTSVGTYNTSNDTLTITSGVWAGNKYDAAGILKR
jgi:hypothetical protein